MISSSDSTHAVRVLLKRGRCCGCGGGGDLLLMWGADGALNYLKELDPLIHASGPCLSDATYRGVTRDGAVTQSVRVRGARTRTD